MLEADVARAPNREPPPDEECPELDPCDKDAP